MTGWLGSRRGPYEAEGAATVVISAKIESEIAVLSREERTDYLAAVGLQEAGLDRGTSYTGVPR